MDLQSIMFYITGFFCLFGALLMVSVANPVYSSLFLVMSMAGIAGLFVTLNAFFVAGVQLIVYAGAVMVLFVMVMMLFNLKGEKRAFSKGAVGLLLHVGLASLFASFIVTAVYLSAKVTQLVRPATPSSDAGAKDVAELLFSKYVFGFEAISVLLLVVAVGVVSIARATGGTHHANK